MFDMPGIEWTIGHFHLTSLSELCEDAEEHQGLGGLEGLERDFYENENEADVPEVVSETC